MFADQNVLLAFFCLALHHPLPGSVPIVTQVSVLQERSLADVVRAKIQANAYLVHQLLPQTGSGLPTITPVQSRSALPAAQVVP